MTRWDGAEGPVKLEIGGSGPVGVAITRCFTITRRRRRVSRLAVVPIDRPNGKGGKPAPLPRFKGCKTRTPYGCKTCTQ